MILPYQTIMVWAESGGIDPFDPTLVNPASIDLRWSGSFCIASDDELANPGGWSKEMHVDRLVLAAGNLYLLDTLEYIKMPLDCAGMLALKSSMGRLGLEHLHAGFFDPGFEGTATLEVENRHPRPLAIERGQRIVQLALIRCEEMPSMTYAQTGRYQGQTGPTRAR